MIVFIILQYNLSDKTKTAIESIEKYTDTEYRIVVVDNYSSTDAFNEIRNYYQNNLFVTVIQTKENLGFANGNNFGVNYVLENFKFKYICVLNNDIYLNSKIDNKMIEEWNKLNFDVMGPDIFRKDIGKHQNPLPSINYNFLWLYSFYNIYRFYQILNILHMDRFLHIIAIATLEKMNKNKKKSIVLNDVQVVQKLHGSFLVFSNSFLEKFPVPFYPTTFMYLEEDFLTLRCQRSNSTMLYYPNLKVDHDHGSTVTTITKNEHAKRKYIFKHNSDSFKALIKYYRDDEV